MEILSLVGSAARAVVFWLIMISEVEIVRMSSIPRGSLVLGIDCSSFCLEHS